MIDDSVYDERNALIGYRYYNGAASASKTSDYTVDPLERPLKQVDTTTSPATTTTYDFTYVGVTNAVSKEVLTGTGATTKKYSYDAFGNRATITEGSNKYSYLYDPHGSVSVLIDQSNTVKESYGYSAYGSANAALTKTASGFNSSTNPYRYTGKRLDSGSGTYDMGARRYSASTGRFLQYDLYSKALDNLGLSEDPLTQNRYALAGANPVNFVEIDGHVAGNSRNVIDERGSRCNWNTYCDPMAGARGRTPSLSGFLSSVQNTALRIWKGARRQAAAAIRFTVRYGPTAVNVACWVAPVAIRLAPSVPTVAIAAACTIYATLQGIYGLVLIFTSTEDADIVRGEAYVAGAVCNKIGLVAVATKNKKVANRANVCQYAAEGVSWLAEQTTGGSKKNKKANATGGNAAVNLAA